MDNNTNNSAGRESRWKDNIRKVLPYTPGEQPVGEGIVKLNTNENPYPPAPGVERLLAEFDVERLRLYPDPEHRVLKEAISEAYGVDSSMIFTGVGSDDVLALSFLTFFNSESPILFPDVTYSFYDVWAELYGIKYKRVDVNDDFSIDREGYIRENGGIVIANPNAPTGILLDIADVEYIVKNNPASVVIIDEAYIDFAAAGSSALALINNYDNLLVVRTFSKSRSLAGSRIGFAFGSSELISALSDVKFSFNSYPLDSLSLAVGAESVRDEKYFAAVIQKIRRTRHWTNAKLAAYGFTCLPSSANFVFAAHESVPAKEIFEKLRERNIFVRYFDAPRISNYLRITIGTNDEMQKLFYALEEILGVS